MQKNFIFLSMLTFFMMSACSTQQQIFPSRYHDPNGYPLTEAGDDPANKNHLTPVTGASIGGPVAGSMDTNDRAKLAKALDSSPGRTTQWTNSISKNHYTVTSVQKVNVNSNPYCRTYNLSADVSGRQENHSGTACVSSNGNWQEI